MALDTKVIALYIDFENIEIGLQKQYKTKFKIEPIINKLSELGVVRIRKAYADWVKNQDYRESLLNYGIELIEKPSLNSEGKNGADIKLAIDAVETAILNPNINTFAIVSGDSDFLSLIQKLRESGKYVIILSGDAFTSKLIIKNCDEFISYELIANINEPEERKDTSLQKELSHAIDLLKDALRLLEDDGKQLDYAGIKIKMLQIDPTFTEKKIGFSSFGNFIKSVIENKQLDIEITQIKGISYVKSNLNEEDGEEFETRAPTKKEWKVIFDAVQMFFNQGKGKKSEGNPWILFSYLDRRRDVGLLPISKGAIREALQVLIEQGIISKKKSSGVSPYILSEDFENKKNEFLKTIK
jgi:uncharacterized protein (TIGR00288 family)